MAPLQVRRWKGTQPDADPGRCVLALPGLSYPVEMPGIALPLRALALDGWTVWCAAWELDDASAEEAVATVQEATARLDEATASAGRRLVLAKSLGSWAAGWAADQGVPAVWLTPLLTQPACAAALARATAPALLVAGTRDRTWDEDAAAAACADVVRLEGADHGLAAGDWRRELAILQELTGAVEDFARRLTGAPGPVGGTQAG